MTTITDMYEAACADTTSDIHEHLPTFVQLALEVHATTVIELGVRHGNSTLAWLHAMGLTGGHLWSVDVDLPPYFIESSRWTFLHGDDCDTAIQAQLPDRCDIVFIDTDHEYLHTVIELVDYGARVRPGGLILLHDTMVEHPDDTDPDDPAWPVRRAIDMFCGIRNFTWINDPACFGLGQILVGS